MADKQYKNENGQLVQYDEQGNKEPVGIESLTTDRAYTASKAASIIIWKDSNGTIYADGPDGSIDSGSDFASVLQSALNEGSGRIYIVGNSDQYKLTNGVATSAKNTHIIGDGMGWDTGGNSGTTIQATQSMDDMVTLSHQFSGLHGIGFDGRQDADKVVEIRDKDCFITQSGIEGGSDGLVQIVADNIWITRSFIEYADSASYGIQLRSYGSKGYQIYSDNIFFGNQRSIETLSTANLVNGVIIKGNKFAFDGTGIKNFGSDLKDWTISNNVFRGIGRDFGGNGIAIDIDGMMENSTITGNVCQGESETQTFVSISGSGSGTQISENPVRDVTGSPYDIPAEVALNGTVELSSSPTGANYDKSDAGLDIINTSTTPADEYRVAQDGSVLGPFDSVNGPELSGTNGVGTGFLSWAGGNDQLDLRESYNTVDGDNNPDSIAHITGSGFVVVIAQDENDSAAAFTDLLSFAGTRSPTVKLSNQRQTITRSYTRGTTDLEISIDDAGETYDVWTFAVRGGIA